jgi:hypothetical protein
MNNSQSSDIFVAKTDPQGNFLWVRKAGGGAEDDARSIAVGPAATVYVAGFFAGNASFGSASLTSQGGTLRDMFLAQYSTDGTLVWVRQGGGTGEDEANGVATDDQGNALVTGSFFGPAAFGTNNLSGNGTDIFVVKYDSTGVARWARKAGGNDSIYGDAGRGIASDASGNVYLTGYFSGTGNFGATNLTSSGFNEIFAAKYDPSGTLMWVRKAGGQNIDIGYSLAVSGTNRVFVGGFFYGSAMFDNAGLSSSGFDDAFLMQLASLPPPRLNIQSDGNAVTLSWPDSAAGFILESSENPSSPTNWVTVPSVTNAVTLPVSSPSKFFRLRRL